MTRCPQCEQSLDLRAVWGLVSLDRLGCPDRPIAVNCPACSTPLRVATFRSAIAVVGSYLVCAAFAVVNVRQSTHPVLIIVGLVPFLLAFIYTTKIAQRFAVLVPVREADNVEFPIEDFQAQLKRDALENPAAIPDTGQRSPWSCRECGESNPGNFEACWKCSSDETTVA